MSTRIGPEGHIEIPRNGEELKGHFAARESQDPILYKGYADLAEEAVEAVEDFYHPWTQKTSYRQGIAVLPGRPAGVLFEELTDPGREFIELFFATYSLRPVIDETSQQSPYGRILWQAEGEPTLNLVEERFQDRDGPMFSLTIVGRVAKDIGRKYYSPKAKAAIRDSVELSRLADESLEKARSERARYWELIDDLPTTDFESPYDQATES